MLLLLVLHFLVIDKSIPKQGTTIEANRDGKGRKWNGSFDLTWIMAKTKSLKPIDLYQSRKEYSENYTLSVF